MNAIYKILYYYILRVIPGDEFKIDLMTHLVHVKKMHNLF